MIVCWNTEYLLGETERELRIIGIREKVPAFNCTAATEIAAQEEFLDFQDWVYF